ncbi:MAG: membrane protein insertase YidC [Haliscomenobacter sp.]|nr:membrane protein insertase YidC [Haliscomenobacter sp.]MBP9077535.1 membrane protein insertase YidC [Haliscomenobacter sp.]
MDRNTIIGLSLIFVLFFAWQYFTAPSKEALEAQQRTQDSLARAERSADSLARLKNQSSTSRAVAADVPDSIRIQQMSGTFGPFAAAAVGEETEVTLENELLKVTFSTKGGRIKEVLLKQYAKMERGKNRKDVKKPLVLLSAPKDRMDFVLPIKGASGNGINTGDLYFEPVKQGNQLVLRANAGEGKYFEQRYVLPPNDYKLDYSIKLEGLDDVMSSSQDMLTLSWVNYLGKIEKATRYERTYSTLYFRPEEGRVGRCSATANSDKEDADSAPLKWVSSSNQFFNTTLFAEKAFASGVMETKSLPETADYMKVTSTTLEIPVSEVTGGGFAMHFYNGPNEFKRLYAMGMGLEEVIPFGRSILGTINRWVIRKIFSWLSGFIGSAGLVIFVLTLLVKLLLYPLSYRMLYSQAKMSALKPEMEKMREKYKDDQQRQQMETMTLYREFGVNPLGSCMPMLLQMPIWIALYRFFPASIEFRQKGFWWANDLSSYDEFIQLPFSIPFGFGDHISMFTMLWVATTLIYTWYNSKSMDFSANPALKYMQYIMPVMFMGFFNGYASGLTAYLLFSNVINIGQTLVTKHLIIDEKKIIREMEAFRKKPKKEKGFSHRLQQAMKDQQRITAEREASRKKGK